MFRPRSLFAATALTLLAALGVTGSASANQLNLAPTKQTATSNALSYGGAALGLGFNDNRVYQQNSGLHTGGHPVKKGGYPYGGGFQVNVAPTTQTATSNAVSLYGPATAVSSNQNQIGQVNGSLGGSGPQINIAPTVQTATSNAVSIGGPATAVSSNVNGVSQGSLGAQ